MCGCTGSLTYAGPFTTFPADTVTHVHVHGHCILAQVSFLTYLYALSVSSSMLLAELQHCRIEELLAYLGPDYYHLRASCVVARNRTKGVDLPLEILKWHCVNSLLLDDRLCCLDSLGRLPLRCSSCDVCSKQRRMFRYSEKRIEGYREGVRYLCCLCVFDEVRYFVTGMPDCLITQGGADCRDKAKIILAIMCRMRVAGSGFLSKCFASIRSERVLRF